MSQNNNETSFVFALLDKLPSWSYGAIVTILAFGIVLKVLGIDFAGPLNAYSEIQIESVRMQNENIKSFNEAVGKFEAVINAQSEIIAVQAIEIGKNTRNIELVQLEFDEFGNRIYSLEQFRNNHDQKN